MDESNLYQLSLNTLLKLQSEEGFLASDKSELFGCLFGRDSAITILKIIRAQQKHPQPFLMEIAKKTLLSLVSLQGKNFNLESGEEPGKFIHEYRKTNFEHLTKGSHPWYIYPEGVLKNYDSIDSTPLILIAIYKYYQATEDNLFLITALPAVEAALNWLTTRADLDQDYLIEYQYPSRQFGGLIVQSWTDSHHSLQRPDESMPPSPIAPVEAQAYAWLALNLWADYYQKIKPHLSQNLLSFSKHLKSNFNQKFLIFSHELWYLAQALDGQKQKIPTITANPLLCLWASYNNHGKNESILDDDLIPFLVKRAFDTDLFDPCAGIRTMSSEEKIFNPNPTSYHNGSFWPMLNGLIVEGLENFQYFEKAQTLKTSTLKPIYHFQCPIELYNINSDGYCEFCTDTGQTSCHFQAWSAAAILDLTASP